MKKESAKSVKKTKKAVRKDLFEKFTLEISSLVEKQGYESKKSAKEINKVANHLAKMLSGKKTTAEKEVKHPSADLKIPAAAKVVKAKAEPAATEKI